MVNTQIQLNAVVSAIMNVAEEGVNVTSMEVDYAAGSIYIKVGE